MKRLLFSFILCSFSLLTAMNLRDSHYTMITPAEQLSVSPTEPRLPQLADYIIKVENPHQHRTPDLSRFIHEQMLAHYGKIGQEIREKYGKTGATPKELNEYMALQFTLELDEAHKDLQETDQKTLPKDPRQLLELVHNELFIKLVALKAIETALDHHQKSPFFVDQPTTDPKKKE